MRIVWTTPAISDLEAVREYIARDSEYYATRFVQRLVGAVEVLRGFPELGAVVPEFEEYGIRERLLGNYRILYQVRVEDVLVLAIVHARRDLDSLELEHE